MTRFNEHIVEVILKGRMLKKFRDNRVGKKLRFQIKVKFKITLGQYHWGSVQNFGWSGRL